MTAPAEPDTYAAEITVLLHDFLERNTTSPDVVLWAIFRMDPTLTDQARRLLATIYNLTPVQLEILEGLLPDWTWDDELRSVEPLVDACRALAP